MVRRKFTLSPNGLQLDTTGRERITYGHGQYLVHRLIMAKKLGRELKRYEVVHHIDGNPTNNHPDNLAVLSKGDHTRLHHKKGAIRMAAQLVIPDKHQAQVKAVVLKVSTGKGDDKSEQDFDAELPATLADAVSLLGEKAVFRRFINAHVVYLQGVERSKLQKAADTEPKERKRAQYLESLGL